MKAPVEKIFYRGIEVRILKPRDAYTAKDIRVLISQELLDF